MRKQLNNFREKNMDILEHAAKLFENLINWLHDNAFGWFNNNRARAEQELLKSSNVWNGNVEKSNPATNSMVSELSVPNPTQLKECRIFIDRETLMPSNYDWDSPKPSYISIYQTAFQKQKSNIQLQVREANSISFSLAPHLCQPFESIGILY